MALGKFLLLIVSSPHTYMKLYLYGLQENDYVNNITYLQTVVNNFKFFHSNVISMKVRDFGIHR